MSDIQESASADVAQNLLKFAVTIEREYVINIDRVMADFGDEIRADIDRYYEGDVNYLDSVLRDTFDELCGTWADQDHVDGKYVWLVDTNSDFDSWSTWDKIVTSARAALPPSKTETNV